MARRLENALSPYLRAHADNPVDWFPWGPEAFAEAQRRDVPLLISIGYSTCHWCHVMARESFSDPAIAARIDEGFVAVKVDREEHPDVDAAYMAAASLFTRGLGWPLTVFATPDGRAFFAGTYWPPVARPSQAGFVDVLAAVREAWTRRRDRLESAAATVAEALASIPADAPGTPPDAAALAAAADAIAAGEDLVHGGFGSEPKFPVATVLRFLQTPLVRREAPGAAASASRALAAMAGSELCDLDGGFFRYATRRDWSVPHYERMLTDNAQLLDVALDAGSPEIARGIAGFLLDTLRLEGGAFGAAQDSESTIDGARSEGGYYRHPLADRPALVRPAVDEKAITGWNGLAIGALARAGAVLGEREWVDAAATAASTILRVNRDAAGRLVRASVAGVASDAVATAADHGLLAEGLFGLALATGAASWAVRARDVLDDALEGRLAADPVLAAHGLAVAGGEGDGDLPSGPSSLALAALTAWRLGAGERYREAAVAIVARDAERARREPFAHAAYLRAAAGLVEPPRQIVVVDGAAPLREAALRADADLVACVTADQASALADAGFALFEGKADTPGLAHDCRGFACRLPASDPDAVPVSRA
ncbi:thioredoxin domain-containing protein [Microbacterium sp. No. 7]|uniref:thioredoxin domain-containing protein n=1 Tax=Microbacterium sp. No. 7 TaxID=1714373 RepID=UPI0006D145A0|nr:DUF255 domain-containing protein [Microbacterium sp. No. 7]ALJ20074.1 thioredoxin [Microbacterium sp. No. 7]